MLKRYPIISPKNTKSILLVRVDKIGDFIYSVPAFRTVKSYYKDSKIYILSSKYNYSIAKYFKDEFTEIIPIDTELKDNSKIKDYLKTLNIDIAIFFWFHDKTALLLKEIGIKIVGRGQGIKSMFYLDKFILQQRHKLKKHELEYNLDIVEKFLSIPKTKLIKDFELNLKERKNKYDNENYIIIHPINGGSATNIELKRYANISNLILKKNNNIRIYFTGIHNEQNLIDENIMINIDNRYLDRARNLSNSLDFDSFLYLIKKSKALISTSTGPLHIASSLNTNSIGIFSPVLRQKPQRWSATLYKQNSFSFCPQVSCPSIFECKGYKCKYFNCMNLINDRDIVNLVLNFIS